MTRFQDKTVIVAGGATLIGGAIAKAFAASGAKVAVGDIDDRAGERLAADLGAAGDYRHLDLSRDDDIEGFVAAVAERFGSVDILVNMACTYEEAGIESSWQQWQAGLGVNLVGPALMAGAVRPHMRRRGGGAIVNLGSVAGKGARSDALVYPVSKAAVLHLTKCLALALAADGIRVNSVSPGWTWSRPLIERTGDDRAWAARAASPLHMLRRFAEPEEIAAAVMFLCSEEASFVTGTDLAVDGGYAAMTGDRGVSSGNHLLQFRQEGERGPLG